MCFWEDKVNAEAGKWKRTRFTGLSLYFSNSFPSLFHNMSIKRSEKRENGLETTVQI